MQVFAGEVTISELDIHGSLHELKERPCRESFCKQQQLSTDEEAIAIAKSTRYGLSSYIQTKDVTRAHRIAAALEAGEVLINGAPNFAVHRPFDGIGISGVGKEGGRAGFDEFLRIKSVAISLK